MGNCRNLKIFNGNKIQQNLLRLTTISRSSNTPAVQRMNPSLRCWCAWTEWHGSQPKNIRLKTLKHATVQLLMGWECLNTWRNVNVPCSTHSRVISHYMHQYTIFICSPVFCRTMLCWQLFRTLTWCTGSLHLHSNPQLRYRRQHFHLSTWDNCKCLLSKILSDLYNPDI